MAPQLLFSTIENVLSEVDSQEGDHDDLFLEDDGTHSFAFPTKQMDVTEETATIDGTSFIYFESSEDDEDEKSASTGTLAKELRLLDHVRLLPNTSILTTSDAASISTQSVKEPQHTPPLRVKQNSHPTLSFSFHSVPQDVVLTAGADGQETARFVGDVGVASRSLIARRPLPKPKIRRVSQEDVPDDLRDLTVARLEPFVMPFMQRQERVERDGDDNDTVSYLLTTAKRTFLPRLVSYFECTILPTSGSTGSDIHRDIPRDIQDAVVALEQATEALLNDTKTIDNNPDIVEKEDTVKTTPLWNEACIAIGVTSEHHRTDIMPGWGLGGDGNPLKPGNGVLSYGLHTDDGSAWANRSQYKGFAPSKIAAGDTVGCGIDYRTNTVFYTLNGQFLGHAHSLPCDDDTATQVDFYPTIGLDSHDAVESNFGLHQPFLFDLAGYCMNDPPAFEKKEMQPWKSPQELQKEQEHELRQKQSKALQAKKHAKSRRFSFRKLFSKTRHQRTVTAQ